MELPYSTELSPVYAVLTTSINNEKRILIIRFFYPCSHCTSTVTSSSNGLSSDLTTLHKRQINFVPIALAMAASRNNKIYIQV